MDEKDMQEKSQEQQEWENIDDRQYFESYKFENERQVFVHRPINSEVAIPRGIRLFLVLSWICAAFTAFVSPYFAIPGILLGAVSNRMAKGSGNAAIITNLVLAIVNLIFGFFLMASLGRRFI